MASVMPGCTAPFPPINPQPPGLARREPGLGATGRLLPLAVLSIVLLVCAVSSQAQHNNPAPPEGRERIEVQAFSFSGNTLLPTEALQRAVQPYLGWRLMSDLTAAAQAAQQRYAEFGYGGIVVYVPPFDRRNPVITLAVLEGRIAQVRVAGQRAASVPEVRRSLPALKEGQTPQVQHIDMQVQMANENPSRSTHVALLPGARAGLTDAEVSVRDRSPQSVTVALDNTGNAQTGRVRAALAWRHANFTRQDDVFTLQGQASPRHPDRVRVISASWRKPFYEHFWMLDTMAGWSDIQGGSVATPIGDIRFAGNGSIVGLRGTRYLPRWGDLDPRLSIALDRRHYRSRCNIAGLPAGACGTADTDVALLPLAVDYSLRSGTLPSASLLAGWGVQVGAQVNARGTGRKGSAARFATTRVGATANQSLLRLSAHAQIRLGDASQLALRLNGQHARVALVPGEQFGLGGADAIRGYAERELAADRALALVLEWQSAAWQPAGLDDWRLQWLAFADYGAGRNNELAPCDGVSTRCELASWGVGLRLGRQGLAARVDLARALRQGITTERGDTRGHVSMNLTF